MFNITSQHTSGQSKWYATVCHHTIYKYSTTDIILVNRKKESFIIITVVINSGYLKM